MKVERFLSQHDAATLSRLAENLLRLPHARYFYAEKLIEILRTAILLPEQCGKTDYACLNSTVMVRPVGTDEVRALLLACPHDANDSLAAATVLTPMAMALLGRVAGSIVDVVQPYNRVQFIQIVGIVPAGMSRPRQGGEREQH